MSFGTEGRCISMNPMTSDFVEGISSPFGAIVFLAFVIVAIGIIVYFARRINSGWTRFHGKFNNPKYNDSRFGKLRGR